LSSTGERFSPGLFVCSVFTVHHLHARITSGSLQPHTESRVLRYFPELGKIFRVRVNFFLCICSTTFSQPSILPTSENTALTKSLVGMKAVITGGCNMGYFTSVCLVSLHSSYAGSRLSGPVRPKTMDRATIYHTCMLCYL
jgi:hypothetical protein